MARKQQRQGRRLTDEEIARNTARLEEVNGWLKQVDLDAWEVDHPVVIDGYIFGVYLTHRATGYCILGQSAEGYQEAVAHVATLPAQEGSPA